MADTVRKVVEVEVDVNSSEVKKFDKTIDSLSDKFEQLTKKSQEINAALAETTDPKKIAFLKNELSKVNDELGETNKAVVSVDKNLNKTKKGTSGLAKGFKKVGTALKGAGIGLLIAALATMMEVFKSNQGVVDGFNTSMTAIKIVFTDLFKFLEKNINPIITYFEELFENPQEKIEELGVAIKEGLTKRFDQLMETLNIAGKALAQFFAGDFAKAWETAKEAAVQSVDIITGEDGGLEKIINTTKDVIGAISDYTSETLKNAEAITENTKAAAFLEIQNRELQLSYQKLAEEQRQIRDDESIAIEERIIANQKLGEILQEAVEAEQAVVQKRIEFLEFEAKVLGSNQERELELANLRVEKLDIEERIKGVQSEQLTNTNSLLREQRDLKKSIFDTDVSILDIETASAVALEINEMKKLDIIEEASKKKYELQKEALDAEIAIHEEGTAAFQDATNQRNILEAQRTADVKLQSKARSDLEAKQAELVKQAKLELAESTLNGLSTLAQIAEDNQLVSAKKAFQIQKAISITQATIQGVVAVQKTLSEPALPFPANVITASAIGITSAANVAAIAAKKFDAGGGGSAPSVGGGGASTPSAGGGGAPQFNTVGTSGFNQVAGSIAEQNQEPVKAYVVSTDVTSQQSLDRNSREKSSF